MHTPGRQEAQSEKVQKAQKTTDNEDKGHLVTEHLKLKVECKAVRFLNLKCVLLFAPIYLATAAFLPVVQWLDSFICPWKTETSGTLNWLDTHFPRVSQGHGMVGATCHLCDLPVEQVSRHQHGSHSLVGCPISQLAVAVMAPGKYLSV